MWWQSDLPAAKITVTIARSLSGIVIRFVNSGLTQTTHAVQVTRFSSSQCSSTFTVCLSAEDDKNCKNAVQSDPESYSFTRFGE